jgi:ribose/xylose/arabinose/galactoside ABC-type transport system permease subunit
MSASGGAILRSESRAPRREDRRRLVAWLARSSLRFGSYVAFALVLFVFAWRAPAFVSLGNLGNVFGQSAILGVLAFGMTIVIIAAAQTW